MPAQVHNAQKQEHSERSRYGVKRATLDMMYGPGCCANGPPDSHKSALAKCIAQARLEGRFRPFDVRGGEWISDNASRFAPSHESARGDEVGGRLIGRWTYR